MRGGGGCCWCVPLDITVSEELGSLSVMELVVFLTLLLGFCCRFLSRSRSNWDHYVFVCFLKYHVVWIQQVEIILQNLPLTIWNGIIISNRRRLPKVDDLLYHNLSIDQTNQYTMDGNQISIVVICFLNLRRKKNNNNNNNLSGPFCRQMFGSPLHP